MSKEEFEILEDEIVLGDDTQPIEEPTEDTDEEYEINLEDTKGGRVNEDL